MHGTRIVFDSDLDRHYRDMRQRAITPRDVEPVPVSPKLVKSFRIDIEGPNGDWQTVFTETENFQRMVRVPLDVTTKAIRLVPEETWGANSCHLFAWDLYA